MSFWAWWIFKKYAYIKSIINDSVITYKEIKDRPETASIHPISRKTKYCIDFYILHTISLVTISLLLLTIIALSCYYIRKLIKAKKYINILIIQKWLEVDIKNFTCYYFDDKTNINNPDPDNALLNETSYETVLIYEVTDKTHSM